jgi:hypothetical protein
MKTFKEIEAIDPVLAAELKSLTPNEGPGREVQAVYDVANNVMHYQTAPYFNEAGELTVKRLGSVSVNLENVNNVVTSYEMKTSY